MGLFPLYNNNVTGDAIPQFLNLRLTRIIFAPVLHTMLKALQDGCDDGKFIENFTKCINNKDLNSSSIASSAMTGQYSPPAE